AAASTPPITAPKTRALPLITPMEVAPDDGSRAGDWNIRRPRRSGTPGVGRVDQPRGGVRVPHERRCLGADLGKNVLMTPLQPPADVDFTEQEVDRDTEVRQQVQ